jgi:Beta-xylosidase
MAFSIVIFAEDTKPAGSQTATNSVIYPAEPYKEKLYNIPLMEKMQSWGNMNTHDPAIYKDGDTYYVFSTDYAVGYAVKPGIQVRKSKDLIRWQMLGQALDGVPEQAEAWTGATNLWAPDVTKIGDTYYLYYAASQFGVNQSFIGVAISKSIEGPWQDQGKVIATSTGDFLNAIDPNIVYDKDGDIWMVYGSFWSGAYIIKLDKKTGKPAEKGYGKQIATRSLSVSAAVEGPYVIYNPQFKKYYLFVSYGSLNSDYNVRVGRSDAIDGPYMDADDHLMTDIDSDPDAVGNKVLGGYKFGDAKGWLAPGHNTVLKDGDDYYIVHHARGDRDKNWSYLHIRKILWSKDGWPMVSPERYAGEKEQVLPKEVIPGAWDVIVLDKADNSELKSKPVKLLADGKIDDGTGKSKWQFASANNLTLSLFDQSLKKAVVYECKVMPAWDWENRTTTLVFTGIDDRGVAVWGKTSPPPKPDSVQ